MNEIRENIGNKILELDEKLKIEAQDLTAKQLGAKYDSLEYKKDSLNQQYGMGESEALKIKGNRVLVEERYGGLKKTLRYNQIDSPFLSLLNGRTIVLEGFVEKEEIGINDLKTEEKKEVSELYGIYKNVIKEYVRLAKIEDAFYTESNSKFVELISKDSTYLKLKNDLDNVRKKLEVLALERDYDFKISTELIRQESREDVQEDAQKWLLLLKKVEENYPRNK